MFYPENSRLYDFLKHIRDFLNKNKLLCNYCRVRVYINKTLAEYLIYNIQMHAFKLNNSIQTLELYASMQNLNCLIIPCINIFFTDLKHYIVITVKMLTLEKGFYF